MYQPFRANAILHQLEMTPHMSSPRPTHTRAASCRVRLVATGPSSSAAAAACLVAASMAVACSRSCVRSFLLRMLRRTGPRIHSLQT